MMQSPALLREFVPSSGGASAVLPLAHESQVKDAYDKGVEDGLAQARADLAAETLLAVTEMIAKLDDLASYQQRITAQTSAEAGDVIRAVIQAVCPHLAALGLADRAVSLLENELCDAPRPLTLSAAPDVASQLESLVSDKLGPDFMIEASQDMAAGRVEITWSEGGATLDADTLATRIIGLATQLDPHTVEENPHD